MHNGTYVVDNSLFSGGIQCYYKLMVLPLNVQREVHSSSTDQTLRRLKVGIIGRCGLLAVWDAHSHDPSILLTLSVVAQRSI